MALLRLRLSGESNKHRPDDQCGRLPMIHKGFSEIGYIWTDYSSVTPRTLPGYVYDLNEECQTQSDDDDENIENRIANDAILANQQYTQMVLKNGGRQLKLVELWKKNNSI
ncbi:unnamed protein product [Didymodactylos carnosus]|uniref:Uncharacterized protein n=1 Tax=Didymodactylos carnosus TaxID=1234261 RepID=A0A814MAW0_9BILA|nr:unnamed protein product [Didymodactylos carnosus]CAF1076411.1 unnamed protein product [Didymodactylos carnosus]CAF1076427.1 unnamed protein product [Didymodactylos carnosus]CAF3778052.1 unnamed protein product [Didymodactylos carnosus]CAF3842852.1 unnamed protein product [Didymodactylos carnosus]